MKNVAHAISNQLGILASFLCLGLCACGAMHPARDNAFRVRGKIEAVNKTENCQLEIHRADTTEVIDKKSINLEFQETVGIAPGLQEIYVVISCLDSATVYKSPVFEVGKADQYIHPLDLGVISLKTTRQ